METTNHQMQTQLLTLLDLFDAAMDLAGEDMLPPTLRGPLQSVLACRARFKLAGRDELCMLRRLRTPADCGRRPLGQREWPF